MARSNESTSAVYRNRLIDSRSDPRRAVQIMLVLAAWLASAPARADLILTFYEGTSITDNTIGVTQITSPLVLTAGGAFTHVQVVLQQTAGTSVLTTTNPGSGAAGNGLAGYLFQGTYSGPSGNFRVNATSNLDSGTTPAASPPADSGNGLAYGVVREFRTGVGGANSGGTQGAATAFRLGGLFLNPLPSPGIDAQGRILLGTFRVSAATSAPGGSSSIVFGDSDAAPSSVQFASDNNTNLDAILWAGGRTFGLPINVTLTLDPVIYVNNAATGNNTGRSWADAFTSLQTARYSAANSGGATQQIWVAAGTYTPDVGVGISPGDRTASFQLVSGVAILGGFAGNETELSQRDPAAHVTILSGDLNGNDTAYDPFVSATVPPSWDDNSFHVVRAVDTNATTILDGFTITHGRANGAGDEAKGAGFLDQHADVAIRNCVIERNVALDGGGGVHLFDPLNQSFSTRFEYCTIRNNRATNGVSNAAGGLDSRTGDVVVQDCTFTQNRGCFGGACAFYSINSVSVAVAVRRCTFDHNAACSVGAGIFVSTASATHTTISECQFTANRSVGHGGAISLNSGNVDIVNCKLRGNSATTGGAIRLSTSPLTGVNIVNSEFVGNTAHLGAAAYVPLLTSGNGSLARFTNCTFVANVATTDGGGLWCSYGAGPVIKNCILWNNADVGGMGSSAQIYVSSGSPTVNYSLIKGGWTGAGGTGVLTVDPLFKRNPSDGGDGWGDNQSTPTIDESLNDDFGDLRLNFGSVAIDHADNTAVPLDTHDLDGDGNTVEPLPLDLTGKLRFVDLPCIADTGIGAAPQADIGAYEYAYNVAIAPVILVKSGATGDGSGLTWANAVTDLQDAICAASSASGAIGEIWVAAGTYRPTSRSDQADPRSARFTLANGTTIYGGFLGNEALLGDRDSSANVTILTGDLDANDDYSGFPFGTSMDNNAYHVVNADGVDFTAVLDGVTIRGGRAVDAADPLNTGDTRNQGGGLHASTGSPTIVGCTINHNVGLQGGGAFSGGSASPAFEDCAFTANAAVGTGADGGGLYSSSAGSAQPVVENCLFDANTAVDAGGAIDVNNNSPLISRSTFRLNRADRGGAIFSISAAAHPYIFSCVFNGNQAVQQGGAFGISGGGATVCNCAFSGNTALGVANGQGAGGAIFSNAATATYINCTVSGNVAGLASGLTNGGLGGGFFLAGAPAAAVLNTIVWGNTDRLGAGAAAQITLQLSTPSVSTSNVQGGWTGVGTGNINADPLFVALPTPGPDGLWNNVNDDYGGLQLQATSPCIDTGDDVSVPADACDLDCDANVVETTPLDLSRGGRFIDVPGLPSPPPPLPQLVDMGAYERGGVPGDRVYVKAGASGVANGSDWANAYPELRTALANIATLGCEDIQVWVAAGAYKPAPAGGSQNATFQLIDGVEVLGGFAGTETIASQRNPNVNLTILSGDLNGDDPTNTSDNCYHVVTGSGVTATAILDGFTIRSGQADAANGGGFLTLSGGPTLRNCRILANGGACGADFAAQGGFVTLDGTTLTSTLGGISLSQSTLDLQGALNIAAGRLDSFGSTLHGVGTLNLAAGTTLHVQSGPPCGAVLATGAAGSMNATTIYTPNVTDPPAVPARWSLVNASIHDVILAGGTRRWVIAPSAQGASATLTWSSPMLEDLSTGNQAEATFHEGGSLQITGDLYDASTSVPTLIVPGALLLSANVSAFRVRETGTNTNVLQFTQAPILLPTGGFLAANNLGFLLAGDQTVGLGATFACNGTVNNFDSAITLAGATSLTLMPVSAPQVQTILRSRITGTGNILIDPGAELVVENGALVDLSGQLPGQGCADVSNAGGWGGVAVNGSLIVRDSTVQNTKIDVKIGSLEGVTHIINNDCRLLSAVAGSVASVTFGGEFFVSGTSLVQCNVITSDGDRYLDLDPDPSALPRPTIGQGATGNKTTVNIRQGAGLGQGELLELRSVDWDYATVGGGLSGAWPLAVSSGNGAPGGGGYTDAWVLEKLEVFDNAKVNLTNRQGFVFQNPAITIPEALYVKTIKLHPGAVLNTGLQRMYYQTLVDQNNAALAVNPNDPHALLANGSRIADVPLLGFSLKVIAMEDDTEFGVRLRTRLRDANDAQPQVAPFKEGEVVRVAAPLPGNAGNHAMAMRTNRTSCSLGNPPCPSASSIAAHGAFARAAEAKIEVKFNYKFCGQTGDELVVYLSDSPEVVSGNGPSPNLVEVARLYPPASGSGSIGSSDFASFSGRFARGSLNFTRGTYVELELRGPDACVRIDDFDPVVCLWCACGDFSGEGACGVEALDYLYLLSEYGNSVNDTNLCADQMGLDHYVDLSDLMNWSNDFHDPTILNLCDGTAGTPGGTSAAAVMPNGMVIAGKPTGNGQNDSLYSVNPQTFVASPAVLAPVQNGGTRSGNGPLIRGASFALYQLHGIRGLIRLNDGQLSLAPKTFTNVTLPSVTAGSTVRVGISSGGGYALLDAAFDPSDASGNTVFVLPVQVDPPGASGSGCPYRAAAKVQLTGGGNCNLLAVYGANPATGSTIVATGAGCDDIVFAPDASRMRELDVDAFGNLFVSSAQGVNDNHFILIYPAGGTAEIRASLAGQIQAPTALMVYGDQLYVSTSLDGPDTGNTVLHRYRITRTGSIATGIDTSPSGHAVINISGIRFLTALTLNPGDGRLYAAGFGSLSCSRAACAADPSCPLGCRFNPGDPIFTTPMLASIANPAGAIPVVTVSAIIGSDPDPTNRLGLPISLAIAGPICGIGDFDGNGQTTVADVVPFIQALLATSPSPTALCAGDTNGDSALNGKDIQPFVRRLMGG